MHASKTPLSSNSVHCRSLSLSLRRRNKVAECSMQYLRCVFFVLYFVQN